MSDHRNDDWLDRILRDDARIALEDTGFTDRVLGALPASYEPPSPWMKPMLVIGSTALGGLLATFIAPIGPTVIEGAAELARLQFTPAVGALLAMTATLIVAGWVLAED